MTPEERAEKIVSAIYDYERDDGTHAVELVAVQIREAVEEAIAEKMTMPTDEVHAEQRAYEAEIKAEAYEDAAKIADEDYYTAAQRIRYRAKEVSSLRS
jgi:hypothetical protein